VFDELEPEMKFAVEPTLALTQADIQPDRRHAAQQRSQPLGGGVKRAMDIVLSGAAIVLLAPVLIGLAFLVQCSSPGPVLYGHSRVGFGGKTFRCWKFRSMVTNGDAVLANHLRKNATAQSEWSETQKLRHDPRVTALGRVLRKLSLDELPQLFNIFLGDMSIVGPRPIVMDEVRRYGPSLGHYLRTRPGLTGLWQISGRSDVGYRQRVLLDRVYVKKWNLLTDIGIILRTVPAVLRSRGSY
jgi:exopolysaccharide production protein ExoY